ncbi:MAG TPA: YbhB/YbcL family Raf kinase inhibitor-like protein [Roseiflexaceae bacterium]|nr:YbhB/YbcL family Raf kinase inhibitor-like protein [Roseiflexaceae bacterium]
MGIRRIGLLVLALACLAACGPTAQAPEGGTVMTFTLTSAGFAEGAAIPAKYTCDGQNIAPPLRWEGPPDARSFVLIVDDPDAPGGTFTHWVLYDIPGAQRELPEGIANIGAPGMNDFSRAGYGGPCPPPGSAHRYVFTLAALDVATLNLPPKAARKQVEAAMRGHVIGQARLMGRYQRRS